MEVSAKARVVRGRGRNTQGSSYSTGGPFCLSNLVGVPVNVRHPPIHTLKNDELLHLFGLYLLDGRDADGGGEDSIITHHWDRERLWYKLARVCRRWRHLILDSSNCLGIHLVCTYGIPVANMLAHSPPLPLFIFYLERKTAR